MTGRDLIFKNPLKKNGQMFLKNDSQKNAKVLLKIQKYNNTYHKIYFLLIQLYQALIIFSSPFLV